MEGVPVDVADPATPTQPIVAVALAVAEADETIVAVSVAVEVGVVVAVAEAVLVTVSVAVEVKVAVSVGELVAVSLGVAVDPVERPASATSVRCGIGAVTVWAIRSTWLGSAVAFPWASTR